MEKLLIDLLAINIDEVDTSNCTDVEDILSAVITYLSEQPVVDAVEVVHGEWLDVKETVMYCPDQRFTTTHTAETCSACKVRTGFVGMKEYLLDNTCPNCGAKMDGDGNG